MVLALVFSAFFLLASFLFVIFGIKAIKEGQIDIKLLKIIFRISSEINPEQSYKLLYPKEVAEKKLAEFYSGYNKMNEKKVIFFGAIMIFFGIAIFLVDIALLSTILFKH